MDCSLPTDVIVDVLSRLPVKSLLRFRFRLSVVDMVDEIVHSKFEVRISDLERVVCCRNLVCLVSRQAVHVCNPSTHELVKLPDSPNSNCRFHIAFGYLPSTNQYKLLTWFHPVNNGDLDRRNNMGWNVFSVSDSGRVDSGSWKLIRNQPYRNFLYLDSRAVCVNGVIYWRFTRTNPDSVYSTMLSFDLEKEEHELIFHPKLFLSNVDDNAYLLELKGYLSLVDRHPDQISIWIMKDQKNSEDWVLEYTVNLPLHFLYDYILVVASIDAADNGEEELVFLSKNEGVLYYNVDDGSIRSTDNLMHLTMRGIEEPFQYFDSFFSLGSA
ncbi:hypothetical protein F0562_014480 [Nyssa sinensis]|uniref:F-box associated beta-propeller type 3 domain-containing protein n=1 Tax=Nyssa sinensis TaxID=561372 RepID=A0A5J4ZQR7_9ASTE|nr:hypothetical protein F0562_014480 [Nyssa sinensis]